MNSIPFANMTECGNMGRTSTPLEAAGSCLSDPTVFRLYRSGMQRQVRNDLIVPLVCMAYFVSITRFNLQNTGNESALFTASFVSLVTFTVFFLPFLLTRLVVHHTPRDKTDSHYYKRCVAFQEFAEKLHFQDVICVIGVIVNGFNLLGRVYAGQCSDTVTIWTSQTCNPFADAGSIPSDQVMIVYLATPVVQLIVRGVSTTALLFSWLLSVSFVSIASGYVGGYQQIWLLVYSLLYMMVTYMIEGLTRTTFMQGQAMIAASAATSKQVRLYHVHAIY